MVAISFCERGGESGQFAVICLFCHQTGSDITLMYLSDANRNFEVSDRFAYGWEKSNFQPQVSEHSLSLFCSRHEEPSPDKGGSSWLQKMVTIRNGFLLTGVERPVKGQGREVSEVLVCERSSWADCIILAYVKLHVHQEILFPLGVLKKFFLVFICGEADRSRNAQSSSSCCCWGGDHFYSIPSCMKWSF